MINEKILKITGGACLSEEVDASRVVNIRDAEISIYEVSKRDNNDGTFNLVYKGKITSPVVFDQGGKTIRGTDKTKKSVRLRFALQSLGDVVGTDRSEFYNEFMDKLIPNVDEVWELLKTLQ